MQLSLHRWLQMWFKTPGACQKNNPAGACDTGEKLSKRFMVDPVPFYWLAQLLLLAFQEGLPPFARETSAPASASPASAADSPNVQVLHDPSPFAPPASVSSPFSPSPFAPSPFSSSSLSSGSSPAMSSTPPPGHRSPSGPTHPGLKPYRDVTPDAAQFRQIKQWLHYIRLFLRRSQGSPTAVWDELMKIRLCGWQGDVASVQPKEHCDASEKDMTDGDSGSWLEGDGLIGFFEEKMRI
jgi:hypothetical protein